MAKKVVIGVEAPSEEKEQYTKGLYVFPDVNGVFFDEGGSKYYRTLILESIERTPHMLESLGDRLWAMSRAALAEVAGDQIRKPFGQNWTITAEATLDQLLANVDKSEKIKVINKELTNGCVTTESGGGVYLALYLSDRFKWKVIGGYLLYSDDATIDNLKLISEKYRPTGRIVTRKSSESASPGDEILAACGKDVVSYPGEKKLFEMRGKITALDALDRFTVAADSRGGFVVHNHLMIADYEKKDTSEGDFDYLRALQKGKHYLPSEASSILLHKKNDLLYYCFFGVDDGKIVVYDLTGDDSGKWSLQYHKTIRFQSSQRMASSEGKDNFIRGMKLENDFLNFALGDLYIRMGISTLLDHDPEVRIDPKFEDMNNPGLYLAQLKATYDIAQICKVPHRITDLDIVETK